MVSRQVVARFRRSLRPINRIKHVVDIQQALPVNTQLPVDIVTTVDAPTIGNSAQVQTGATVSGFYGTVECVATESTSGKTPNVYIFFAKNPGNLFSTFPNGNAVGVNDRKKYVIHQEMVMIAGDINNSPRNIFKGVIKIPKGYQRCGPDDRIQMYMFIPSTGVAINICAQFHYKEFR